MSRPSAKHSLSDDKTAAAATHSKKPRSQSLSSTEEGVPVVDLGPPIDISNCLRMTSLCMNQLLQEPGLTRHIRDFYDGLLMQDVAERTEVVIDMLGFSETMSPRLDGLIDELVGYMNHYAGSIDYMMIVYYNLTMFAHAGPQDIGRELIWRSLESLIQAAQNQRPLLGHLFANLINEALERPSFDPGTQNLIISDWNSRLLGRLVEGGGCDVLLHVANNLDELNLDSNDQTRLIQGLLRDVLCAFSLYLDANEEHPRRAELIPQLNAEILKIAAAIGDDDEEVAAAAEDDFSDDDEDAAAEDVVAEEDLVDGLR